MMAFAYPELFFGVGIGIATTLFTMAGFCQRQVRRARLEFYQDLQKFRAKGFVNALK